MKTFQLSIALLAATVAAGSATAAHAGTIPGKYIVVLKDSVHDPGAVATEHVQRYGIEREHTYKHALTGYAASGSAASVAELKADRRVAFVSPQRSIGSGRFDPAACLVVTDCDVVPFGIDRINADRSSTISGDGTGAVSSNVAVLDGGIDPSHPDLNVSGRRNCVREDGLSDPDGHGTHVAGTIAARDNGSGVVGVAPGARVWDVRVLGRGLAGTEASLLCGIDWVTATRQDADPSNDIAVANMSLTGSGADDGNCGLSNRDPVHLAICDSVAAGVTSVVAAGNEAVDLQDHFPAAYDEVLAVSAMADYDGLPGGRGSPSAACTQTFSRSKFPLTADDTAASFSNFATLANDQLHTIAAPGVCVLSAGSREARFTDGAPFVRNSGTSMAAPHAAGTVALCIASGNCRGLTPRQIIQKIVSDARTYNTSRKGASYGFLGDPLRGVVGKYYGYLTSAGLY